MPRDTDDDSGAGDDAEAFSDLDEVLNDDGNLDERLIEQSDGGTMDSALNDGDDASDSDDSGVSDDAEPFADLDEVLDDDGNLDERLIEQSDGRAVDSPHYDRDDQNGLANSSVDSRYGGDGRISQDNDSSDDE